MKEMLMLQVCNSDSMANKREMRMVSVGNKATFHRLLGNLDLMTNSVTFLKHLIEHSARN
jgi:hypothetical protein